MSMQTFQVFVPVEDQDEMAYHSDVTATSSYAAKRLFKKRNPEFQGETVTVQPAPPRAQHQPTLFHGK